MRANWNPQGSTRSGTLLVLIGLGLVLNLVLVVCGHGGPSEIQDCLCWIMFTLILSHGMRISWLTRVVRMLFVAWLVLLPAYFLWSGLVTVHGPLAIGMIVWMTVMWVYALIAIWPAATATISPKPPRCSFCGRRKPDVNKLIAGPGVYICDSCVSTCQAIVDRESPR